MSNTQNAGTILTVPEVCEALRISRRALWALLAAGSLTPLRYGKRTVRFEAAEIERFLAAARARGQS